MKKQYNYYECRWPNYEIILYHDGVKVEIERKDLLQLDGYLEELEAKGYTLGYTEEEVEQARKRWEHMHENRIEKNGWKEIR